MLLNPGTRLGPYEILAPIGAGGMGEVYRARDTRLSRDVAIKTLPVAFAADPERLARFRREAQVLASLNHPNIAAIYGLEEQDGTRFLVMELVEGKTLAGPLPVDEVLGLARQLAEALEAAHEKGVMHRDLKPANIKVTPDGKLKVLDFGLAKAFAPEDSGSDLTNSPTISLSATRAGTILGTAGYMSPEQARGKSVDRRTDIWAFGCVLYELLSGRRAFPGDTVSDTIAAILKTEPDWSALAPSTPEPLRNLVRRCLRKDVGQRLQHIGDARVEIADMQPGGSTVLLSSAVDRERPASKWRPALVWGLLGLLLGVAAGGLFVWKTKPSQVRRSARLAIPFLASQPLETRDNRAVAISPDGSRLVYVVRTGNTTRLYQRALDDFQAKPIPGTEDGLSPFFSPEGQWLAFFSEGKLKKVAVNGGPATILCDARGGQGGSWGTDGTIYFTPHWSLGLFRVSASGGKAEIITRGEPAQGESTHVWPEALPGGQAVLFTRGKGGNFGEARIAVLVLKTGEQRLLIDGGSDAHYVSSGHLIYSRSGALLAAPFDLARLAVTGPSVPVVEGAMTSARGGEAQFSISSDGTLVYVQGSTVSAERSLLWVDRSGKVQPATETRRAYEDMDLSPDGSRAAFTIEGSFWNIWIHDLARNTLTRLTFESDNRDPLWTPDGKRVTYGSFRNGRYGIFLKAADGSGQEEMLTSSESWLVPESWSPDGRTLIFVEQDRKTGTDLWILQIDGDRKPRPFLRTPFNETNAVFSPDSNWLAYASNESGRDEVYVQAFPGPGGKWQISAEGGSHPEWAASGRELFYRNSDKLMAVDVETKPSFRPGTPRLLFEGHYWSAGHDYAVHPSGQRFLMIKETGQESAAAQINVVLNWFEELRRRVK